jgi:nitrous oxide reductase accessory protein NosL
VKQKLLTVIVLLAAGLASCGGTAEAGGPPDIQYGRDVCVQCGMIITEEKFAAAYTLDNGTEKSFDDVGGLLLHQRSTGDTLNLDNTWVHDYETAEWVDVQNAYFVATLSVSTPMGHSVLAFSDEASAEAFASSVDGEVLRWDVVFAMPEQDGLVGHHHMKTDDMDDESMDHDQDG